MFAIIFVTWLSSAPRMTWPRALVLSGYLLGTVVAVSASSLCCRLLCMEGDRTGQHTHGDFVLVLKLLFFKGTVPFLFLSI